MHISQAKDFLLNEVFDAFLENGFHFFNAALFAPSEKEHIQIYHQLINPSHWSTIVDLGCGIGAYGAALQMIDSSLRVINVVNDQKLIQYMKKENRECIFASYTDTGLPKEIADIVMFNESIGYESLEKSLNEAFRLLKKNGKLVIKDFSCVDGKELFLENWSYKINKETDVINQAIKTGYQLNTIIHPMFFMRHWKEIINRSKAAEQSANLHNPDYLSICPVFYEFIKGNLNEMPADRRTAFELV